MALKRQFDLTMAHAGFYCQHSCASLLRSCPRCTSMTSGRTLQVMPIRSERTRTPTSRRSGCRSCGSWAPTKWRGG
eukprot:5330507-Amphidinium_carterae.1